MAEAPVHGKRAPAVGAPPEVCPLSSVRPGTTVIVRQLTGSPDINQRLREMGFGEDQRIKVITLQDNLLCQVCNSRLGLSGRLAASILVEPVPTRRLAA
jgi:Fe2+ transport system protein FeoA